MSPSKQTQRALIGKFLAILIVWMLCIALIYLKADQRAVSMLGVPLWNIHANLNHTQQDSTSAFLNIRIEVNDSMDNYPFLLKSITNQQTGKSVTCNPLKYKYFRRLLHELDLYFNILNNTRTRTTSADLDMDTNKWCKEGLRLSRRERIQIIDGNMYVSSNEYYKYGKDLEGYRTSLLLYMKSLMKKYSSSIEDTDFIYHFHDVKIQWRYFRPYIWRNNATIPYFFTDSDVAWRDSSELSNVLFGVSRNYMKYRYFADEVYRRKEWKSKQWENVDNQLLMNPHSYARIVDYLQYKQFRENKVNMSLFDWKHKPYNKALFVGGQAGYIRPKFIEAMLNDSYIANLSSDYFDVLWQSKGFPIAEQMKYKFVVVMDGTSVRDGFLYQLDFGAVLLKQLSSMYEWWLFDLVDHQHVIFYENILHLISIVVNMVDRVHGSVGADINKPLEDKELVRHFVYHNNEDAIHSSAFSPSKLYQISENAKQFKREYLNEESVDCFMINMLRVYNHYLFDANSITPANVTGLCEMTKLILDD